MVGEIEVFVMAALQHNSERKRKGTREIFGERIYIIVEPQQ